MTKTIGKKLPVLLFIALFAVGALAQAGQFNVANQIAQVSEFDVNGLKVILKRRASSPTVTAGLFIRGGVLNYDANNAGIEAFSLAAAVEGSAKFPRDVLRREMARSGSSISSGAGRDYSVISLASTIEEFNRSWEIYADIVMNPKFDPRDVERIREQMLASLREQETDNDNFLNVLETRQVYAGHPYSRDPNGTPETIARLKPTDLRDYQKRIMQNSQLVLVVVGDIDQATLKQKVASTIALLPRGNYVPSKLPQIDFSKPTIDVTARDDSLTNYVRGVFDAPTYGNPDYYPMEVAINVLSQRLFQEIRVKRQLTYAVSAEMHSNAVNSGELYVTAVDANQAVTLMLNIIRDLRNTPLEQDEINGMAGQFLTGYYLARETNAAQGLDLAKYELFGGGWKNSFYMLDRLRAVTPADVQRVSQKYLKNFKFIVIGNPNSVEKSIFLQRIS